MGVLIARLGTSSALHLDLVSRLRGYGSLTDWTDASGLNPSSGYSAELAGHVVFQLGGTNLVFGGGVTERLVPLGTFRVEVSHF
ncbi:MAG: hypothetical protein ACHREM_03515 [Polyangiales bacterium]